MDFYDRQTAAVQAAEDYEKARHDAGVAADFPRWEYKVLTESAIAGWRSGTVEDLDSLLNHHAEAGWRVVAVGSTGQIKQFVAFDKAHLYIVLERPAIDAGHRGHPVQPR